MDDVLLHQFLAALAEDNRDLIAGLLRDHDELREKLNQPLLPWAKPPLAAARSVPIAKLLMEHGATPERVGRWWTPGFNVRSVDPQVAAYLVEKGAPLSPHAAAALGLIEHLTRLLDDDPHLVEARGGDGAMPLHFARDVPTAQWLLQAGAELDARDDDHDSTPSQWLIGDAPEVTRYLIEQGATPDIFLAAALGDHQLVKTLIRENPLCLSYRIGKLPFPSIGYEDRGGTILQWTLGFNSFPHQIAAVRGHDELVEMMFQRSDVATRLLVACLMALREQAEQIVADHPKLVESLPDADLELLARYCWETNANVDAVRLMLDVGFPVDHPESSHGYSPLHNAAWGGYGELVELLIERGHPTDLRDPVYRGSPLGWAIHCCTVERRHPDGEYARVFDALIDAGNPWDVTLYPTGDPTLDATIKIRLTRRLDGAALLGDAERIEQFLTTTPTDEELSRALVAAAYGGQQTACQRLLNAGAVARPAGFARWTPLLAAAAGNAPDLVDYFLERGADIGARNRVGGTILHTAIDSNGDAKLVQLLIQRGADQMINATDDCGQTPLDLALAQGKTAVAQQLRAHGATCASS